MPLHISILAGISLALSLVFATPVAAESYRDPVFGFQLTVPDNWQVDPVSEGSDRVLKMQSPDGNAYGEVRAVHLSSELTATGLREAFAKATIPQATLVGAQLDTASGMTGEIAAWRANVDGRALVIGGFFAVDGPVGYILLTITAESAFSTYSAEFDRIFETFVQGHLITAFAGQSAPPITVAPPTPEAPEFDAKQAGAALHNGLVAEPHPELGFVFVRYETWGVDQPAPYSIRVGLSTYPPEQRPSIVVEALSGEAYQTLQAGAEDLKQQLSDMPGIQFDQEGPHLIENIALNGVPLDGWSFGASYLVNGIQFRQLTFLFKRDQPSVYYSIYITGPADVLIRHKPEMMRMLSAIQIIPFS